MKKSNELDALKAELNNLKEKGKVLLAYLYGSYAAGTEHKRSDIDLAIYLNTVDEKEAVDVIDNILMASEISVEILRLDDEEESPFIIQEALKGISLIEPDIETLYRVADRALHETEGIRQRRAIVSGKLYRQS